MNLVFIFLIWIAEQTGLEIPGPPSILFVSTQEMSERSGRPLGAVALYDRAAETLYLPSGWSSAAIYDRAMLLHELVHHIQESNRVPSRCNAERERQAYDLTRKWLSEQGVADPYSFLNLDELTITILSSCPDADGLPG
jgi:hypothetical protein